MSGKFENISMMGRMAYVIMCVEKYLLNKYPNRNWKLLSEILWKSTSTNWAFWTDMYSAYIPEVVLDYGEYSKKEFGNCYDEKTFQNLQMLYEGITSGSEDDADDELNFLLNKPFEMAMVYEGTEIGDGEESFIIIEETERVLESNGIILPDVNAVSFSNSSERNGWGNYFDGSFLSVILK